MATTVQELINYLTEIKDKKQPVIYQYYLAEHLDTTPKKLEKVADELDCNELWNDAYYTLKDYIG